MKYGKWAGRASLNLSGGNRLSAEEGDRHLLGGVGESSKIFKALEIMFSVCYVRIFLEDKRAVLPTLKEPVYLLNLLEFESRAWCSIRQSIINKQFLKISSKLDMVT